MTPDLQKKTKTILNVQKMLQILEITAKQNIKSIKIEIFIPVTAAECNSWQEIHVIFWSDKPPTFKGVKRSWISPCPSFPPRPLPHANNSPDAESQITANISIAIFVHLNPGWFKNVNIVEKSWNSYIIMFNISKANLFSEE